MLDMGKEFQDTGFEFGNLTVFLTEKIHEFFLRQGLQICSLDAFTESEQKWRQVPYKESAAIIESIQKLFLARDEFPDSSCECSSGERSEDEDPKLFQCIASLEESRSD